MRLTFRNIFFHGAVIFRGPLPKQDAQLENTCLKRATQNPPGTGNASNVRKPNETWIIWGSATEPQIINFHFNSCKNHRVDSARLWQKKQNFHYPVKKVCSGISFSIYCFVYNIHSHSCRPLCVFVCFLIDVYIYINIYIYIYTLMLSFKFPARLKWTWNFQVHKC